MHEVKQRDTIKNLQQVFEEEFMKFFGSRCLAESCAENWFLVKIVNNLIIYIRKLADINLRVKNIFVFSYKQ